MSNVAPAVRPYTEEGQRYSDRSREIEAAMLGMPIVIIPLVKLVRKLMVLNWSIMIVVRDLEAGDGNKMLKGEAWDCFVDHVVTDMTTLGDY